VKGKFNAFRARSSIGRTDVAVYVFSGTPGVGKTHMGSETLRRFHDAASGVLPSAIVPAHARMSMVVDFNGRCDFSHRGVFPSMFAYVRYLIVCGFLQIPPLTGITEWTKAGVMSMICELLDRVEPLDFMKALSRTLLCRGPLAKGQDWSAFFLHIDEMQKLPLEHQREFTSALLQHSATNTDAAISRDARIFPVFVFTGTFIKILMYDQKVAGKILVGSSDYMPGWSVLRPLKLHDSVRIHRMFWKQNVDDTAPKWMQAICDDTFGAASFRDMVAEFGGVPRVLLMSFGTGQPEPTMLMGGLPNTLCASLQTWTRESDKERLAQSICKWSEREWTSAEITSLLF
jgi:hypothetical protein